jgi:O-antigen/teichoic acid export membrane protein
LASSVYGAALLTAAVGLHAWGLLTVASAVLIWGLASALAVLAIAMTNGARLRRARAVNVVWLASRLWPSGRWLAASVVGYWFATWGIFPLVAIVAGTDATGALRALQNLFTPMIQLNVALNLVVLPRVADRVAVFGQHQARTFAAYASVAFASVAALYAGIVLEFSEPILRALYRNPQVVAAAHLLWPLAVIMFLESARLGSSIALLALGQTRVFFVARLIGLAVFAGSSAVLGSWLGFDGILWANALSYAVAGAFVMSQALGSGDVLVRSGASRAAARSGYPRSL